MSRALRRIVIVEDDRDIALLVAMTLEQFGGYQVVHFASGAEALAKIASAAPDLLLLDYSMPGMTGGELLSALRSDPSTADIPAIFMTASVMPDNVERLKNLGALEVFPKPFDPLTLADRIRAVWAANFPL